MGKLVKGDISIRELLLLSNSVYGKEVDDKSNRARLDVKSGKIVARRNMAYNAKTRTWEQTGRDVKIEFMVSSDPISYPKIDTIKKHVYPVTFLIHEISKGIDSSFRFRVGSLKMPVFAKKGSTKKERIKIANTNIQNQVQLNFFFNLEWVLKQYGLLYGRNRTNGPPNVTNKKLIPYFDKTSYWIVSRLLIRLLGTRKGFIMSKVFKEE